MNSKSLEKIQKLKKQKDVILARIQKMEAIEKHKERKRDTRRKILVGSYYLDKAKKENNMHEIKSIMAKFLKRDCDKILFDLPIKK
jgi:hypothetical protein